MGFDSRRLKSVQNAANSNKLPLGYSRPAEIKVHTNHADLSQTYRQALQPELHVYSWQGYLEADDFDAPEMVSWTMSNKGKLKVHLRDISTVSWVRIDYEYSGSRKMQTLVLKQGNLNDGVWEASVPVGGSLSCANITAGDALFNECMYTIDF
jgi:hypothetical protein